MLRASLTILTLTLSSLSLACAQKKNPPAPPAPCAAGVSTKTCGLDVKGYSVWQRQFDLTSLNEQTKKTTIEKRVAVTNEFHRLVDGRQVWRRTTTMTDATGQAQSMFLQGSILSVDNESVSLRIEKSSCDNIDTRFYIDVKDANGGNTLFYQRSGNSLHLRSRPFVKVTPVSGSGGPANVFGQIIAQAIGTVITEAMVGMVDGIFEVTMQAFTFGHLRNQLKSGNGDFSAVPENQVASLALGQIGCFMNEAGQDKFIRAQVQTLDF